MAVEFNGVVVNMKKMESCVGLALYGFGLMCFRCTLKNHADA